MKTVFVFLCCFVLALTGCSSDENTGVDTSEVSQDILDMSQEEMKSALEEEINENGALSDDAIAAIRARQELKKQEKSE